MDRRRGCPRCTALLRVGTGRHEVVLGLGLVVLLSRLDQQPTKTQAHVGTRGPGAQIEHAMKLFAGVRESPETLSLEGELQQLGVC